MWRCLDCSESVESVLDHCWNCGASEDGEPDATFVHADQYTPEFVAEPPRLCRDLWPIIARRPQFTIRGILVFTTLVCILLAVFQRMPLIGIIIVFLIPLMLILLATLYGYSMAYSLLCRWLLKPPKDEKPK